MDKKTYQGKELIEEKGYYYDPDTFAVYISDSNGNVNPFTSKENGSQLYMDEDGLFKSQYDDNIYILDNGESKVLKSPINDEPLQKDFNGLFKGRDNDIYYELENSEVKPLITPVEIPESDTSLVKVQDNLFKSEQDGTYFHIENENITPLKDPFNYGNLIPNKDGTYLSEATGKSFIYNSDKDAMIPLYVPDITGEPAHIEGNELVADKTGRRFEIANNGAIMTSGYIKLKQDQEEALQRIEKEMNDEIQKELIDKKIIADPSMDKSPSFTINEFGEIVRDNDTPGFEINPDIPIFTPPIEGVAIDPYGEYREQMARYFEEPREKATILCSSYIVNGGRCFHKLQRGAGEYGETLMEREFDYNDDFRKSMLEPSITDYAQRSPFVKEEITSNPKNPEIATYKTFSENNNVLYIDGIPVEYAQNISSAVKQIPPVVFNQMKQVGGPVLTRGITNSLTLSLIIGFCCGLVIWLVVLFIK